MSERIPVLPPGATPLPEVSALISHKDEPQLEGVWSFTPYTPGGPDMRAILLDVGEDFSGEASARVARELFNERKRQRTAEGYDAANDDGYGNGELQRAAAAYAFAAALKPSDAAWLITDRKVPRPVTAYHILDTVRTLWPWAQAAFKPDIARRMLVKAGALILAAIEAHDRKAARRAQRAQEAQEKGEA